MAESITDQLQAITSAEDERQLRALQQIVDSLIPEQCQAKDIESLLSIFERFPESDGFGVFWAIVHFLEACEGYESLLIASVRRKPVELNVLMVNRLLNSGVTQSNGQDLLSLLESVAISAEATSEAKRVANKFLEFQRSGGVRA